MNLQSIANDMLSRLEALDAHGNQRSPDATTDGPSSKAYDFDVVLVGGGLSTLLAPLLRRKGLTVAVCDRSRVATAHREWNASHEELKHLVHSGLLTPDELEAMIVGRYREGICAWHGGGRYPVSGVLDHAVDATTLLTRVRQLCEHEEVALFDSTKLVAFGANANGVRLILDKDGRQITVQCRTVVDARGASSPYAATDLVCPTVGGVIEGLDEGVLPHQVDPEVGEILVTDEDVVDGKQHIWEAFPGANGQVTVYLFYYTLREHLERGALVRLYEKFFADLSRYKSGSPKLVRPTFGYITGWSRLGPGPRAPHPRWVLVGDASARHSPLTYCGFGHMLRNLNDQADHIERATANGKHQELSDAVPHQVTGALARMMACPRNRQPHQTNALLDAAFSTLHGMGNDSFSDLLQDRMGASELTKFLFRTSLKQPSVYKDIFAQIGFGATTKWGFNIARAHIR